MPSRDDDSGSLMFALLLMFLATALAGLMTPVLLISMNGTRADQRRVAEIAAAQAGIDVAMAQIRASDDNAGVNAATGLTAGVLSKLPCAGFTGFVSSAGNARYQVTVTYYATDPRGQNSAWLNSVSNQIKCIPNAGARSAPAYALLVSQGTDQATGDFSTLQTRTVQGTYVFQSTNANIAGGLIHVYKSSTSNDLCIDAGSSSPSPGTAVTMQRCASGKAQQTWAYTSVLNIALVSTQINGTGGMCLDAGTPEVANLVVKVQPCGTTVKPQQQWSINDSANFQGTSDGTHLDGPCFNVQNPNVAGSQIVLAVSASPAPNPNPTGCDGPGSKATDSYNNIKSWQPEAAVGAGAASAASGQLVNFNEFGRCLDVPNQQINFTDSGTSYLIVWPCKQAPNAGNVAWNQRWVTPAAGASGAITTNWPGTNPPTNPVANQYCLLSPGVSMAGYVFEEVCPNTLGNSTTWTMTGPTKDYATSYEIVDGWGHCLQATDPTVASPDFFNAGNGISKTIVAKCNGSTLQKWNAPPNILASSPLKNVNEYVQTN